MFFCPECGSLLVPKHDDGKKLMVCSCGYKSKDTVKTKIIEKMATQDKVEVVEKEVDSLPLTKAECEKCGHKKAYFWSVQTRASDEPETKFFKCEKCRHTWRDYS